MNITPEKQKKLSFWIIGIAAACTLIFLGVQNIGVIAKYASKIIGIFMPMILGFALALILNVPMRFFEDRIWTKTKKPFLHKMRRPVAFVISLVLIIGIFTGVIWLVIPELVKAVKVIVQGVADLVTKLGAMSDDEIAQLPLGKLFLDTDWEEILASLQGWLKNKSVVIMNTAVNTIGSFVGGIVNFCISVVFAGYILFGKERLKAQTVRLIHAWLPKKFGNGTIHVAQVMSVTFRNFVSGQSLEAVILGVLCAIGMLILNIPYAHMVGALVGVTALIPVVGAFIGTIVGAFMILTVNPVKAVIFVVFLLMLQQVEGNLIYPRVMGSRVNLPSIWILAAVTVGGSIAGPIGMLLAVPVTSSLYILIREATENRENKLAEKAEEE